MGSISMHIILSVTRHSLPRAHQGVPELLGALVDQIRVDPTYLMGALRPLPMSAADRSLAQLALAEGTKVKGRVGSLSRKGARC